MRTASIGAVFALACSAPAKPAAPPPPPPSECGRMSDHIVSLMRAQDAPTELLDKVTNILIGRCRADGWSPAAQQCFLAMAALADGTRCQTLLTKAQLDAANTAMDTQLKPAKSPGNE